MPKAVPTILTGLVVISLLHGAAMAAPAAPKSPSIPSPVPLMRTYVSGLGSDGYPCTVDYPCQTFKAALQLTLPGGEIFVLNSADYGPVVINKSVTITSEGAMGGVLTASGVGISISAGESDVVNLRGLAIDGAKSGTVGIQFNSGRSLNIQKVLVRNFANSGISFSPNGTSTLYISDTQVSNNGNNGILVAGGSGAVTAALNRITASGNGVGIFAFGNAVKLTVTDTVAGNNQYGFGASAAAVMVRNSTAANNSVGIAADQAGIVRVGQSTVTSNATGWLASNGGQVQSYGNNNVSGNVNDGSVTTTVALQ